MPENWGFLATWPGQRIREVRTSRKNDREETTGEGQESRLRILEPAEGACRLRPRRISNGPAAIDTSAGIGRSFSFDNRLLCAQWQLTARPHVPRSPELTVGSDSSPWMKMCQPLSRAAVTRCQTAWDVHTMVTGTSGIRAHKMQGIPSRGGGSKSCCYGIACRAGRDRAWPWTNDWCQKGKA